MKLELKPYPGYCDAESDFIDRVPSDWDLRPLKTVLSKSRGAIKAGPFGTQLLASEMTDEGPVKVLNQRNVIDGNIEDGENFITEEKFKKLKAFEVFIGDILLTTRGTIGKTCIVNALREPAILHPCLIRVQTDRRAVLAEYLMMLLSGSITQEQLQILSNSTTIEVIYTETLKRVSLPMPSVDEQRDILAFLDRETAKIDRLMEVRRKQVERLQEQRTAVIHQAVTRGLNPNTKLKPSGVEWLGDFPDGWTVKRLKYWAKHISVQVSTMPEGHAYLALEHVESKTGRILQNESAEFDSNVKLFKANDVLFGRLRPYLAKVALPDFDGVCVGELMVLRPNVQELRPRYLQMRLLTPDFISLVDGSTQGAKMPRANWSFVGDIPLAFPSTDEQDAIIVHIDRETSKLDTLSAKYRRELELLAEYRASLISHAVTGKIDLRGIMQTEEQT